MADQIVLSWIVDVAGSSIGPTQAAVALVSVPLYTPNSVPNSSDPVLGQNFGLTVASDVSVASGPTTATRTLTLNMTSAVGSPHAPPPFPCHPRTATPPVLPYLLRTTKALAGSFFVSTGATNIPTTDTQLPSLVTGGSIQFLSQQGVFYTVAAGSTATSINLTTPYTGISGNTGAFKEIAAPVVFAAVYSTSDLDTAGVATVPPIPAGAGARTVNIEYTDSLGAGPFIATVSLTGKRPAPVVLAGGIDIAVIVDVFLVTTGGFMNSLGEITLVALSSALPALPTGLPIGTGIGAAETNVGKVGAPVPRTFHTMTDDAQLLIDRALAYLPPSYFTLAQQGASTPQLVGDFSLTTGATDVPTTDDQTGALAATNIIEFAEQPGTLYVVAAITPKILKLTTAYSGIDTTNTGANQVGTNANAGTKGNIGTAVINKPSGARLIDPSPAAPPTNDQLAGPLAQFVAPETAMPPPNPPGAPATVVGPTVLAGTFLSGLFTRQLQLALAGVPVVPQPITFI
jgi:hypothetical protein